MRNSENIGHIALEAVRQLMHIDLESFDITKYFDQNSKKRDLSDNSNQEEGAKKLKCLLRV